MRLKVSRELSPRIVEGNSQVGLPGAVEILTVRESEDERSEFCPLQGLQIGHKHLCLSIKHVRLYPILAPLRVLKSACGIRKEMIACQYSPYRILFRDHDHGRAA